MRKCDERHRWRKYIDKRDEKTSKSRDWSSINWDLVGEAWSRSEEKPLNLQQRLNRLTYIMDWAPTGEWKERKGYEGSHKCVCGKDNPTRERILVECTGIRSEKEDKELIQLTLAKAQGDRTLEVLEKHIITWVPWNRDTRFIPEEQSRKDWPQLGGFAGDLMTGCWDMSVVGQIVGEAEHELGSQNMNRKHPKHTVEKNHRYVVEVAAAWANYGYKTWRKHNDSIPRLTKREAAEGRKERKPKAKMDRYLVCARPGRRRRRATITRGRGGASGKRRGHAPERRKAQRKIDEWLVGMSNVP